MESVFNVFFSYFLSVPLPPTPTSMVNDDQDNVDDAMLCSLHFFPRIHDQPFNKQFVSVWVIVTIRNVSSLLQIDMKLGIQQGVNTEIARSCRYSDVLSGVQNLWITWVKSGVTPVNGCPDCINFLRCWMSTSVKRYLHAHPTPFFLPAMHTTRWFTSYMFLIIKMQCWNKFYKCNCLVLWSMKEPCRNVTCSCFRDS